MRSEPLVARALEDARKESGHSGDGIILLVGAGSYDADLSATLKITCSTRRSSVLMFVCYGETPWFVIFGAQF